MDKTKLLDYINSFYKPNREAITYHESYKWEAMNRFREIRFLDGGYDDDALAIFQAEFPKAIDALKNMLNGGSHFLAKAMLIQCSQLYPAETKKALADLNYDGREQKYVIAAMDSFESKIQKLIKRTSSRRDDVNSFTGYRTAALFLFFMYPEKYFFYKFREYQFFKEQIGYKRDSNLSRYENCQIISTQILEVIKEDKELCGWYEIIRQKNGGIDSEYHLLVQDIIWSIEYYRHPEYLAKHISSKEKKAAKGIVEIIRNPTVIKLETELKPKKKDANDQYQNAAIGLEGELYVMKLEVDKTNRLFPNDKSKRPIHTSIEEGDGLGYDIKSYDENGDPVYIEVKTTTGSFDTLFYITENERRKSTIEPSRYRLYRVYNFKDGDGDIGIIEGSMDSFCINPVKYKARIKRSDK